jgi:predicted RecA/RadA family phage recombinase
MSGLPGRIRPGPFRGQISARAWNRAQDAADIVLEQRGNGTGDGPAEGPKPYTPILAKNATTGSVTRWGVMSVAGVVFTPSGATGSATRAFQDQPVLSGGLPTGGSAFIVAVEPIGAGKIGRVAVAGVVQTKINVTDAGHGFATAKDGDLTQLSSAASGEAQILWKDSGTGASKWVSGPSGALTFTAINRAQTVTGPTGGYWVGCESIDGTWHLEWAECV